MARPNRGIPSHLLRLAAEDATPDADLLTRFVRSGDEEAFAALVKRYGPMVLGVCRRALGDAHAAEDAFQAAFLALARGAGRVRTLGSLAAWLYGAAVRVSLKARRYEARATLSAAGSQARATPDPLAEMTARELVSAVDEELARLPEQFQVVLVLCCLEGLSQDEAARRLGWSAGSVKGRLERGRERLRERLARRGIALSAGLGGLLLGGARAAVPPHMSARVFEFAASGTAPPAVAELAAGGVPSGGTWKLAAVALVMLAAGGVAAVGRGDTPVQAPAPRPAGVPMPPAWAVDRFGNPLPDGAILRLGTTRLRHANVFSLAFAGDGTLVSFGRDYAVKVWDPATGRLLREREFEKEEVHRFWGGRLSPDGRRLAVQYLDRVKVFDAGSGRELASVRLASSQEATARFSPDGDLLAVADRDDKFRVTVRLYDVGANTCRELCRAQGAASEPVFSRDGTRLALAEGTAGVGVWEVATGRELLRFKPEGLLGGTVDFDPTGDVLAVLGAINPPQAFHYVRVSTGKPPEGWTAPAAADFGWVRFTPDGSAVLLGGRKSLRWCDPKSGKVIHTADGWAATPPAFSPGGKLVASSRRDAIRLWDAVTGRPAVPEGLGDLPEEEVHGVAVSPDGRWVVTKGSDTGTIRVWDSDGRPKGNIRSNRWGGRYPLFSPDGRHLFGVAPDAIALVRWDFPDGRESARYTFAEPAADQVYVYHFGLSADGKRLAAVTQTTNRAVPPGAGGGPRGREVATLTVWDIATAERLGSREVDGPAYMGYGAFAPDLRWYFHGGRAFALSGDPEFRLDLPKDCLSTSQGAASPDGRLVAQLIDERVRGRIESRVAVYETATGKPCLTLPTGSCGPIAFTQDGRGLVVTGTEAITRWDLATGKPVVRHRSPGRFVGSYGGSFASSLVVTPDGRKAVTGQSDTTALVWDLAPPAIRPRELTKKEMTAAWVELAGADAGKAYVALWALADDGDAAVEFLRGRLRPVPAAADDQVRKLIAQLGAEEFADREAAERALRELGDAAGPALRAAVKAGLSAEQARRVGPILTAAAAPTLAPGERLQAVRAVAALEWIATGDARAVLERLAAGSESARLTREARAAIDRLRQRPR